MAKEIQLTRGKVAIVDDEDFEWLSRISWHVKPDLHTSYAAWEQNGKSILMHHLLATKPVDHINGNGLDNQRCNLRSATRQQNQMNRGKHQKATSKFKGVFWSKRAKKWHASIRLNKKGIHLGYFISEVEAAKAYNRAAKELFGEFARPNLVETEPAKDTKPPAQ